LRGTEPEIFGMTEPADARHWLSGEVNHHRTALSRPGGAVTARLIVGRVRDRNEKAAPGQGGLFPTWRYHNVFTDSPHQLMAAEGEHRDHAIVEHVLADLCDGPRRDPAPGPGDGLGPHRPPRPGPHHPPPPTGPSPRPRVARSPESGLRRPATAA
jgi:hypothetical protein